MPDDPRVLTLTLGPLQANCFVLAAQGECLVIDPGDEDRKLVGLLEKAGLTPRGILLTHGHFDHFGAVEPLAQAYGVPVYVGAEDAAQIAKPDLGPLAGFPVTPVSVETVALDGDEDLDLIVPVEAIPTPGHSPGSYTFAVTAQPGTVHLFSGDLLFYGSVGRTDLPGGDWEQLLQSVAELIRRYPPEAIVHCGHGPDTTLKRELAINPFLAALRRETHS